jgi:hypothetical protein
VIETIGVAAFMLGLFSGSLLICHVVAWWAMRTPRAGYLLAIVFALYVMTRNLP